MPNFRVLIVDGDAAMRRSLAEQLDRDAEFAGIECGSGAAALAAIQRQRFDAALVEASLPDMPSRELCRRMRGAGFAAPIVVLAAAGAGYDSAGAHEDGADDVVTKPFRLNVLLSRLREHMRLSGRVADAVLAIGPYAFRPGSKQLSDAAGNKTVRLTEKEAAILEFLHRAGRTIARETLLGEVWGYNAGVTTHTLETHVYRLRRKIERDPANAQILVTEPGGYRLLP
jgi:DNA-binding response OmpR family regulator